MLKLVVFCKRKAGMSVEAFQRHWQTTHGALVVQQPGLRRYVQNHTLPSGYRSGEPAYDGVAEAWFDDDQAVRDAAASPEYTAVRADEANFVDAASRGVLLTDEVFIIDEPAPAEAAKLIAFLDKGSEVSVEHFQKHWREMHGPIAAAIPGNRRYVQCHARPGSYAAGRTPPCDGIAMSWFADFDSLRKSGETPEYVRTRADETNFMAPGRPVFVISREVEIEFRH